MLMKIILYVLALAVFATMGFKVNQIIKEVKAEAIIHDIGMLKGLDTVYKNKIGSYDGFDATYYTGLEVRTENMETADWYKLKSTGSYTFIEITPSVRVIPKPILDNKSLELLVVFDKSAFNDEEILHIANLLSQRIQEL